MLNDASQRTRCRSFPLSWLAPCLVGLTLLLSGCDGPTERTDPIDNPVAPDSPLQDADGDGRPAEQGDCNDADPDIHDGATEVCDAVDNDCDGRVDEGDFDQDGTPDCVDPDADGDQIPADGGDCNDRDHTVHPYATETCNGVDDNCNGTVDDVYQPGWHEDSDGDGYGAPYTYYYGCTFPPVGYASNYQDCNDEDGSIYPGAQEVCDGIDQDCDGAIDEGTGDLDQDGTADCRDPDQDGDQVRADQGDCNDRNHRVHPYATETCNSVDDNCNGVVDDVYQSGWHEDTDRDGYGEPYTYYYGCTFPPVGYVQNYSDCNDADASIHPGATELCDGIDQDCDGFADEGTGDLDQDGTPDCRDPDKDGDQIPADGGDCNDLDHRVHPYATETCNGVDDNCNGSIDEVFQAGWHRDADGDGYGDPNLHYTGCTLPPVGYVADDTDCADGNSAIHPDAPELCDGLDNDCDGAKDEGLADLDGDGTPDCRDDDQDNDGYTTLEGDCDDHAATVHPGATETCDGLDNDCDGATDDVLQNSWHRDVDGDGYGDPEVHYTGCTLPPPGYVNDDTDCDDSISEVHPTAPELCDGLDNDCDGAADEGFDQDGDGGADCEDGDGDGYSEDEGDCDDQAPDTNPGSSTDDCSSSDDDDDGYSEDEGDCDDTSPVIAPVTVDITNTSGVEDGSLAHPWSRVQSGIDNAGPCGEVWVRPGTYPENVTFRGHDIRVRSTDGASVTLINGGGRDSVVRFATNEGSSALLQGFTLTGGTATYGGGVFISKASPTLRDLVLTGNVATQTGGGLYAAYSASRLEQIVATDNRADRNGGGIALASTTVVADDLEISGNLTTGAASSGAGGGLYRYQDGATVTNIVLSDNVALFGGGYYGRESTTAFTGATLRGNSADQGGGAFLRDETLPFTGHTFTANDATNGGGLWVAGGAPLVEDNDFLSNEADEAGGGAAFGEGNPTVRNNRFSGNEAGEEGAGLFIDSTSGLVTANSFVDNLSGYVGGGLSVRHGSALTVSANTVTGNEARDAGGGIYLYQATATITGNTVASNEAGLTGGGLYAIEGTPQVLGNTLELNVASSYGGGAALSRTAAGTLFAENAVHRNTAGTNGGGLLLNNSAAAVVRNNRIDANTAGSQGGGIRIDYAGTLSIRNNRIADNSAKYGGGLECRASSPSILNNTFAGNRATVNGGGIYLWDGNASDLRDNIVAFSGQGEGIFGYGSTTLPTIAYNLVFGNAGSAYGGTLGNRTGSSGNVAVDPKFVTFSADGNPANDDLHLAAGSPAINTGDPAAAYNDADGSRNDLGAYGGPDGDEWP